MDKRNIFRRHREEKEKKGLRIDSQYRAWMEQVCADNGIEYELVSGKNFCEFRIDADLFPRIEKYFSESQNETQQEPPQQSETTKKRSLDERIGSVENRKQQRKSEVKDEPQGLRNRDKNRQDHGELEQQKSVPKKSAKEITQELGVLTIEQQKRIDERMMKPDAEKIKKQRAKKGRDIQVKTRLTEEEMNRFLERVKESGAKQGEFMRECLLNAEVHVQSLTDIDAEALGTIMEMASDLGRIGGLIKGTVVANKENFEVLTPEAKQSLEKEIRELNALKEDLQRVVQKLYGNS